MYAFREVRANRKLDQASFRVTNYSIPCVLRGPRNRCGDLLQRTICAVEVCGLLGCAHNTRRVASHGPIGPVGWGALLKAEEPTPPTRPRGCRLPVHLGGWGIGGTLRGLGDCLGAVWLVSRWF